MRSFKTKSFTIIEAVTSAALLIIFAVAFLTSLWTSFNYLRRVMELRTAALVLQEEASIVRNLKFSDILSLDGRFSSAGLSSLKDATGSIIKSLYEGKAKILKMTFKVDWTAFDGRPQTKSIVTLMTDHGINKK